MKEKHFECGDIKRFSEWLDRNNVASIGAEKVPYEKRSLIPMYCGIKVIEKEGIPKDLVYLVSAEGKYLQSFKI